VSSSHEDFRREVHGRGPSDRSFGFVFTAAFIFLGFWPLRHGRPLRIWWLAAAAVFLAVTLIRPSVLHPLNRIWTRLGILLGRIVSPVVTALLFFLVFTPVALILRWSGKDILHTAKDPDAETYWVACEGADVIPDLANQF
jgi:hypothetical protein